jgi:hypothetical protein
MGQLAPQQSGRAEVGSGSKCEELALSICRPIYLRKPTLLGAVGTAEKCQEATYAPQQTEPLFDHLVGEREQRGWHFEAERFRGLEVDHQLELGRLHNWQVGWLLAFENATDVDADLTERI